MSHNVVRSYRSSIGSCARCQQYATVHMQREQSLCRQQHFYKTNFSHGFTIFSLLSLEELYYIHSRLNFSPVVLFLILCNKEPVDEMEGRRSQSTSHLSSCTSLSRVWDEEEGGERLFTWRDVYCTAKSTLGTNISITSPTTRPTTNGSIERAMDVVSLMHLLQVSYYLVATIDVVQELFLEALPIFSRQTRVSEL